MLSQKQRGKVNYMTLYTSLYMKLYEPVLDTLTSDKGKELVYPRGKETSLDGLY